MSFFQQAIFVEGGMAVIAVLADWLFSLELHYHQYIFFESQTLYQVLWGLFPLIAGYYFLLALPSHELRKIDRLVREMFARHMRHWKLWQLALIAALAGLGEELLFRGLIQLSLEHWLPLWCVFLVTSLIFGLAHAVTPLYCWLAFLISLYLCFLFYSTGNLFVPVAVHAFYDFFVFLFIRFTPHRN